MTYIVRVRYVERPSRWKLLKALIKGEYTTGWFSPEIFNGT